MSAVDRTLNQERGIRKGSDPLTQTARGKLQNQRQKLNDKINKELRMRAGAENLFKAAESNRKLRERVELELSYFNSNIQLLKEQLSEMNSSMEVYQHKNSTNFTPMIPLGLKETSSVDFMKAFKDIILEHYSEDADKYAKELKELWDLREAVRTPERSLSGVDLLTEYFNQLGYVEKRFYSSQFNIPILYHWYDSLSGYPDSQRSVGFEKGSILYNVGALFTQIACKQDRTLREGILQSIVHFEKAAGSFKYLDSRFSSAPSHDMKHETLSMLQSLMLAQSQECVLESILISGTKEGVIPCTHIAQEAAMVSKKYSETHAKMLVESMKTYLPFSWLAMSETKLHFYRGLAHYYVAIALMDQKDSSDKLKLKHMLQTIHIEAKTADADATTTTTEVDGVTVPATDKDRKNLGKAHLREAVVNHEESLRIHGLCKQLRKIDSFGDILQKTHERSLAKFYALEEEDDFSDPLMIGGVAPKSEHNSVPVQLDFSKVKVVDIFWKMGPITIFNAQSNWSPPRRVVLERQANEGFGFSVKGDSPVCIADLEEDSVAMRSGMKMRDYIVGVGSVDTKWSKHDEVVQLVRQANLTLGLLLMTPIPKPDPQTTRPFSTISLPASSAKAKTTAHAATSATSERERKTTSRISAPWMFIRRNSAKENSGSTKNLMSLTGKDGQSQQQQQQHQQNHHHHHHHNNNNNNNNSSIVGNGNIKLVSNGKIKSISHGNVEIEDGDVAL